MGKRSIALLIVLLVIGGLLGSLLGIALSHVLPILDKGLPAVGFAPVTVDLSVLTFTIGMSLKFNVASIIGFLLALVFYFKI